MAPATSRRGAVEGYPEVSLRSVDWTADAERVRGLFRDYRRWIADHADPGVESAPRVKEGLAVLDGLLERLPAAFGPPRGDVLLFYAEQELIACGGIREQEPSVGELDRIYIRSDYRGEEFGKPFVRAHLARARELGFGRLRAYVLGSMAAALDFYQELGFHRIPPYWPHPASGTVFFERALEG